MSPIRIATLVLSIRLPRAPLFRPRAYSAKQTPKRSARPVDFTATNFARIGIYANMPGSRSARQKLGRRISTEQACNRSRRIYAPTLCLFYPDGDVCGIGFAKGMEVINLLRDAKRADCARAKKQTALRLSANRCRYRITPTASACRPLRSANNCRRPSGRPVRLPHSS